MVDSGTNKMRTDMKKIFKFFAAALAIVAAASCAKEFANDDTVQTPEVEQELVHKVFSASLNLDPETRTTLHTDGVTVHWTEGDKIALIPAGKTNASHFSINPDSIDGTFADFEGQTVVATDYVGVYPSGLFDYSQSSWDGSMIHYFKGSTLATQYAHVGDFPTTSNGNANIAISTTAKDGHLYFQNVNAYFKFQLAFDNAAEIVISADEVSNDDPKTQSTSTILNLGTQLRYKNGFMYGSSGDSPISFKVDNNKTAFTKNATYYVAIPAVYVKGLKFTVKDASGAEITSFTKSSFTFEQNKIYNLGLIDAKKSYSVVKQLSHATELEDGKLYVISYMKDIKMFWSEQEQWVKLATFSYGNATYNEYEINNVFKFHKKPDVTASIGNYKTTVVGMWESLSNGKYMSSNPAMNGTSSNASYISIGQWDGTNKDFDMYVGTSSGSTLYYNGTRVAAGSISTAESNGGGQQARKWYIYEVKEK